MDRPPEDHQPPRQGQPKKRSFWGRNQDEVYEFRDSNLRERHGYYPLWLAIVAVVLVLWSVWYAYTYWGPPPR